MTTDQISNELIAMAKNDLAVRERLLQEGELEGGYNPEMERVHQQNAAGLREIIAQIGWPTISRVGAEASDAAWLIVQHSIGEPEFVMECYGLMEAAADDINPQNLAYLYDRICYFEGRPQRYGTQFDDVLYPVEDLNKVNELRNGVGMKPHPGDVLKTARQVDTDGDLHQNDPELNEWRKQAGWI